MKKMKKLHSNPSCKGPSTKYDDFVRVSMDKNEENNKQADSGPARGETWGKMKGKEEEKSR